MNPSSVHETSNSARSSGNSGGSASYRKCETPCAKLTTPMTRASCFRDVAGATVVELTLTDLYSKLLLKGFCDKLADGDDLFDHRRVLDWIGVPFHRPAARAQRIARTLGPGKLH